MVLENITATPLDELTRQVSFLTRVLQALGGFIVLYIIFNVINVIINRRKNKRLEKIEKNLEDIKGLLSKKKK